MPATTGTTGAGTAGDPAGSSCPSVYQVLARADGGLARIRVPAGRIGAEAVEAVGEAAARSGSGVVEITNRANLQVRGIRRDAGKSLAEALLTPGLSGGPAADRRRNILLDPLGDLDEDAVDFAPVVTPLLAALDAEPRLDELDGKFGFALDGGGRFSIAGRRATVVATAADRAGVADVRCGWVPDGEEGSSSRPRQVLYTDLAAALVAAALDSLGRRRTSVAVPVASPVPAARVAGPLGSGDGWVGAMPVLGRTDPPMLAAIAAAARRYSKGLLRLTPWRGVVFPGVCSEAREALISDLRGAGLVVEHSDPASTVVACAGSSGCTSGATDAIGDARLIIAARRAAGKEPLELHVSGCAKCCAHHAPAALTMIGSGRDRYDLYSGGELRASAVPSNDAVASASVL